MTPKQFARLPPKRAIAYMRGRKVALPDDYYSRAGTYRQQAFSIAGLASLDALQAVLDSLNDALRRGESFADWKRSAVDQPELGVLPKHRLENIFRTNLQGAYARGTYQRQAEVADRRPYLMYDAVNDSRTRPSHRAMDGFIARHDDPIWAKWRPPVGYRCRCAVISLTEAQARARGLAEQVRPRVEPDPGWDYDRSAGIQPGIDRAVRRRKAQCGPLLFAGGAPQPPIWCRGVGKEMLERYALDRNKPMPEPRPAPGPLLTEGQDERFYLTEFMQAFGAQWNETVELTTLGPGLTLEVSRELFIVHGSGKSKLDKRGRAVYAAWIAAAIREPDEVWVTNDVHGARLNLLARFRFGGRLHGIVAVFKKRGDVWVGWSGFQAERESYLAGLRNGEPLHRRDA
jgi:SPP1 gp7 family putative phage head morphogenesis protein